MEKDYKYCEMCRRPLPLSYKSAYCPACEEMRLFDEVREFVRSHDVNEYQVAEVFDIPVRVIKQWIKEGRMEYKENDGDNVMTSYCARCGAKVNFGSLCPKCLRLLNGEGKGYAKAAPNEDEKMRFLDKDE